jgi:hypothetical protein
LKFLVAQFLRECQSWFANGLHEHAGILRQNFDRLTDLERVDLATAVGIRTARPLPHC